MFLLVERAYAAFTLKAQAASMQSQRTDVNGCAEDAKDAKKKVEIFNLGPIQTNRLSYWLLVRPDLALDVAVLQVLMALC